MLPICRGFRGALLVGVLPPALFASGHTFFVRNLAETLGLEPYAAHNNFQFSGLEGKRHRFRETGLWTQVGYLPPCALRCMVIRLPLSKLLFQAGSDMQSLAAMP